MMIISRLCVFFIFAILSSVLCVVVDCYDNDYCALCCFFIVTMMIRALIVVFYCYDDD